MPTHEYFHSEIKPTRSRARLSRNLRPAAKNPHLDPDLIQVRFKVAEVPWQHRWFKIEQYPQNRPGTIATQMGDRA